MTFLNPAQRRKNAIIKTISKEGTLVTINPGSPRSFEAKALIGFEVTSADKLDPTIGDVPEVKNTVFTFDGTNYGLILIGMKLQLSADNGKTMTYEVNLPHPVMWRDTCLQVEAGAFLITTA